MALSRLHDRRFASAGLTLYPRATVMFCCGVLVTPSVLMGKADHPSASIRMSCRNARMSRACHFEVEVTKECPEKSPLLVARGLNLRCPQRCEVVVVVVNITRM